jgi:hypothetical protein
VRVEERTNPGLRLIKYSRASGNLAAYDAQTCRAGEPDAETTLEAD